MAPLRSTPLRPLLDRYLIPIAGFLLTVMCGTQIGSAIVESPTNDEPIHLTASYIYLTKGRYNMDLPHPPLGRVLAALPLLALPLNRIPAEKAWPEFRTFIWGNRVSVDTIMLRARLVTIALTLLFGAWLCWWTRRHFGPAAALLALTFFTFDPNLIAHGHYVTTDLIVSFGIFLTCTLWADFLLTPSWKRLILAALALGMAILSKYSALFLLLVLPVLYFVAWTRNRSRPFFTWRGAIITFVVMGAGAGILVALAYAPDVVTIIHLLRAERITAINSHTLVSSFGYFRGLRQVAQHNAEGNPAYLLGHLGQYGWWDYFPVAFLVKTPTGVFAACGIAALSLLKFRLRPPPALLWLCLALPPLIFFTLAMCSSIDIGVRYILPVYPFLYVLLAVVLIDYAPLLLRSAWPWTVAALMLLVAVESLSNYPHYLAFFNWASGGAANGSHYLLDSNLDWGQDSKNLANFVRDHHVTPLCTALFGTAPGNYYVREARNLHQTGMPEGVEHLPCVVAVSANFLHGLYIPPAVFAPLRQRQPMAEIGHSIYLYDLRH